MKHWRARRLSYRYQFTYCFLFWVEQFCTTIEPFLRDSKDCLLSLKSQQGFFQLILVDSTKISVERQPYFPGSQSYSNQIILKVEDLKKDQLF